MDEVLSIYIAGSFRHRHGVRLLSRELRKMGCLILDWTAKATPPPGLSPVERRVWMDTDLEGGEVYAFCRDACLNADLLIYYGESGQDAGVEVGLASAIGAPILGICGPLEGPGLMLHGAVTSWASDAEDALDIVRDFISKISSPEKPASEAVSSLYERYRKRLERKKEEESLDA